MRKFLLGVATLAFGASLALAEGGELKVYTGQGGPIPDSGGGLLRSEIFIPDHGEILNIKSIDLSITHTWVGDLVITLTHKDNGRTVTLLDRPGVPESTFGNSDNLDGIYSFTDGLPPIPEAAGPTGLVPPGGYGPSGPGSLHDFNGKDKFGIWSLRITDNAGGDVGTLNAWRIVVNNVPEPATLGLLLIGGLGLLRRR